MIDIVALCATIFGLTTTLGFGAMQLNAGLSAVGIFSTPSFSHIILLIIIAVGLAILSAISGVSKGIRYMSQGNLILAISLLLFILVAGPTVYILSSFTENVGYYLTHIIELSFRTFAYENTKEEWFTNWTITYWAWWISWAPFVGLFIAKISKGRTIREFVVCVLLVPTLFNIFWMTVFGNGAIWVDAQTGGILTNAAAETEKLLFLFLDQFPFALVTSLIALLVIAIFFHHFSQFRNLCHQQYRLTRKKYLSQMADGLMGLLAGTTIHRSALFRWPPGLTDDDRHHCPSFCHHHDPDGFLFITRFDDR